MEARHFSSLPCAGWCWSIRRCRKHSILLYPAALSCFAFISIVGVPRLTSLVRSTSVSLLKPQEQQREEDDISIRDTVLTAKGMVTYAEIEQNVFLPNNYKIMEPTFPVPKLDFILKPTCTEIFESWLNITKRPAPINPPKEIENADMAAFLLNGYSILYEYKYSNEKASRTQRVWDKIGEMMVKPRKYVGGYGKEALAVYYALRDYSLENMTGFVIGSREPWIEVQALRSGASKVYTVEYQPTKVLGTTRIKHVHPTDFAEKWKENLYKFDFAITFSSIEHSGLGRYGDPIDPIGDIREVQKVMCLLRQGVISLYLPFHVFLRLFYLFTHRTD
ncbi:hypothetical protein Aduo_011584 [Ancylostoma duodenale]